MSKGRSTQLIEHRNAKLAARYYWYSELLGLKLDRCLDLLIPEFDLAKTTLYALITENACRVDRLANQEISHKDLRQQYPYLNWRYEYSPSTPFPTSERSF